MEGNGDQRVRFLFVGLGLVLLAAAILVASGHFASDEADLSFDEACDPAEPFERPPPRGLSYGAIATQQVDSMIASIEGETGPSEFGRDDLEGRTLERPDGPAGFAWSMRAPAGARSDQLAAGLTAGIDETDARATTRETRLAGREATVVRLDLGVGTTTIVGVLSGCRFILVQGSDERLLRRVATNLIAAD